MGGEVRRAKYPALQANLRGLSAKDNQLVGRVFTAEGAEDFAAGRQSPAGAALPSSLSRSFTP
jgi:hypothetical protein